MEQLRQLSSFIADLKFSDVPENVRQAALLHVLDTVGAAVGGAGEAQAGRIREKWLAMNPAGQISVWGTGQKTAAGPAAFLNAMAGHTLEMDDVHTRSKTHIGTVVVPAAWAAAEYGKRSGEDFLLAVICGYEVMSRIGMGFGVTAHRNLGWHVTATAGTFGAAAACAKLLGLDEEKTAYALGLAGAQSFGTWAFLGDGASCKVLNPARAAQCGLEAAFLAESGMSGPVHILTADDGGILKMMSDQPRPELIAESLGSVWETLYVDNKPYPSCRSTHCAIDGALALREEGQIPVEEIEQVEVETYQVGYKQCGFSDGSLRPQKPVQAKFSTPFTVACALLFGEFTLKQLTDETIASPQVRTLMEKVKVCPKEEFSTAYPSHWGCRVRIRMKDGAVREVTVPDASGSVSQPLTEKQVYEKALSLMEGAGRKGVSREEAAGRAKEILRIPDLLQLPEI